MLAICLAMLEDPSDSDKFTAVHDKYHSKMLRFALGITQNEYDAKEVVQNSFVKLAYAFHKVSHLEMRGIESYLHRIVRNEAINFVTRSNKRMVCLDMDLFNYFEEVETPETDLVEKEAYTRIVDCIKQLPYTYRDVLSMSIVDELKPAIIADVTNKPINTVKSTLKRGRKMLKEKLEEARIK